MLSKSARAVTFVGSRYFSVNSSSINLNKKSCQPCLSSLAGSKLLMLNQYKLMSTSLADDILKAKKEQEKGDKKDDKGDDPGGKKGPQPLTKWQKYGYVFFGVFFTGSMIANAVLFCNEPFAFQDMIRIVLTSFFHSFTRQG